jgi:hypothetical protein
MVLGLVVACPLECSGTYLMTVTVGPRSDPPTQLDFSAINPHIQLDAGNPTLVVLPSVLVNPNEVCTVHNTHLQITVKDGFHSFSSSQRQGETSISTLERSRWRCSFISQQVPVGLEDSSVEF